MEATEQNSEKSQGSKKKVAKSSAKDEQSAASCSKNDVTVPESLLDSVLKQSVPLPEATPTVQGLFIGYLFVHFLNV